MGIKVPMPIYKAKELVPNLIIREPDFKLYTDLANKMIQLISDKYTNQIEVASIDECYIDATDIWQKWGSPKALAIDIQNTILKQLSLPISIGISYNKFVAKMSTSINKPFGISITKPGEFLNTFGTWDIQKFHGIGKAWAPRLRSIGINTILDLANTTKEKIKPILGKNGYQYIQLANGHGPENISTEHNDYKGIGSSITFQDYDREEVVDIFEQLSSLVQWVVYRIEKRNLMARVITISYKTVGGKEIKPISHQIKLDRPVGSFEEIFLIAKNLFLEIWDGYAIKYIGIRLSNLFNIFEDYYQISIYDEIWKYNKVEDIITNINKKFKKKVLVSWVWT